MIRNRLAVLLAERGLKITRVAKDTGISRNTITATAQNDSEMIRLETINTLCKYLSITPCEFFEYEPLDISFSLEVVSFPFKFNEAEQVLWSEELKADLFMDIDGVPNLESVDLTCSVHNGVLFDSDGNKKVSLKVEFDDKKEEELFLNEVYSKLKPSFHKEIYYSLYSTIEMEINKKVHSNITNCINKHLDSFIHFSFLEVLSSAIENYDLEIQSDVFKPF
ncbi:helix-turn-helix domain-containing protein [Domibacillus mangrovi]|uniref:HTH cro/C1-type domain-containing protein n=1 Tax=Domibacillus mangrovi TaxID=1714354 RepID=A0A1Q5NZI7_9BACI|nr:helix-turn-helix transcriptional regulator [Domibacillus mangrovi]OKL35371.1 hypothetical protein BLL40_15775 [Domibacillus mangrovi]